MEQKSKAVLYKGAYISLKRTFLVLAVLLIAISLLSLAFLDDLKLKDKTVADMQLVTLDGTRELDAGIFTQSKLSVVNVWATFCGPCIYEMPDLAEAAQAYADKGVQFIGVCGDLTLNADGTPNAQLMSDALDIIEATGVKYLQCRPAASYYAALPALISSSYPGTIIVDSAGNITKIFTGAITKEKLAQELERQLAAPETEEQP